MKICVIYGSPRMGNTYRAVEILKTEMDKMGKIEFIEFFLPKDMPKFCQGCFSCFLNGENTCPHSNYIEPIVRAMKEADGLIFATPTYVLSESGGMKVFLDHLGWMFIPHRPIEEMFSKVAIIISTTAGAGTGHAIKPIRRCLNYFGMKRVYSIGFSMYSIDWKGMKEKRRSKYENMLIKGGKKFYKTVENRRKFKTKPFTRIMFYMMKKMIKNSEEGNIDKRYWKEKGWLQGKKPF